MNGRLVVTAAVLSAWAFGCAPKPQVPITVPSSSSAVQAQSAPGSQPAGKLTGPPPARSQPAATIAPAKVRPPKGSAGASQRANSSASPKTSPAGSGNPSGPQGLAAQNQAPDKPVLTVELPAAKPLAFPPEEPVKLQHPATEPAPEAAGKAENSPPARAADDSAEMPRQAEDSAAELDRPMALTDLLEESAGKPQGRPSQAKAALSSRPASSEPSSQPRPPAAFVPASQPAWVIEQGQVVSATGMVVNDKVITIDDVLRRCKSDLQAIPPNLPEDIYRDRVAQVLDKEIRLSRDELLFFSEAERRLTDPQKEQIGQQVEQTVKDRLAEAEGSVTRLERQMAQQGTTLAEFREKERRKLMIQTYLRSKFMPAISINRQMLLNYYRQHRAEFVEPKKVQMQLIAAPLAQFLPRGSRQTAADLQAAKTQAKDVIDQAAKAVASGEDFGLVAQRLSRGLKAEQGGLWQAMPAGSFREKKVEEAAFALDEGAVSTVIETDGGYYLVKAAKVIAAKEVSFEEAQLAIEQVLREEQFRKLSEEYFGQFQTQATILYSMRFLETAVGRAMQMYWRGR